MKASELLNMLTEGKNYYPLEETDVEIVLRGIQALGPVPTVPIESAAWGFDWDSGKLLILPRAAKPTKPAEGE